MISLEYLISRGYGSFEGAIESGIIELFILWRGRMVPERSSCVKVRVTSCDIYRWTWFETWRMAANPSEQRRCIDRGRVWHFPAYVSSFVITFLTVQRLSAASAKLPTARIHPSIKRFIEKRFKKAANESDLFVNGSDKSIFVFTSLTIVVPTMQKSFPSHRVTDSLC